MAERTKRETRKEAKKDMRDFKVRRAYEFDNGNISFDFEFAGITFYGSLVVRGKNGDFISFPSRESNGKYYKYYYIELSEKEHEDLIQKAYDCLDD